MTTSLWRSGASLLALLLLCVSSIHAQRAYLKSMAFNNWQDSIVSWATSQNCEHGPYLRPTGVNGYRVGPDMSLNTIKDDSFALLFGSTLYADPTKWDIGGIAASADGVFTNPILGYNNNSNPLPFEMTREYVMPPYEPFYIVRYNIKNTGSSAQKLVLFEQVTADNTKAMDSCQNGYFFGQNMANNFPILGVDLSQCGGSLSVGMSSLASSASSSSPYSYFIGQEGAPLSTFIKSQGLGPLPNISSWYHGTTLSMGHILLSTSLAAGESVQISSIRSASPSGTQAIGSTIIKATQQPPQYWFDYTASHHQQWLSSGLPIPSILNQQQANVYKISLVLLKHAQNPLLGTIVASFSPLYLYKVWSRDAVFAAIILQAAGHRAEAEHFLRWASIAQPRPDDNAFHTCYDWYTGAPVGFVEPQYDGTAAYLLALAQHLAVTGDSSLLQETAVRQRMQLFESFFLNQVGAHGLAPPDYSIWEESSDPLTGQGLPTSYFSFTQGMAYAGLVAASRLESSVFNNQQQAVSLLNRATTIQRAVETNYWSEENGHYIRSIWGDSSLSPDLRMDSASSSILFGGMLLNDKQNLNETRVKLHLQAVRDKLTRVGAGIARYEGDPFFYDSLYSPCGIEISGRMPPWGVTTMFTLYAEQAVAAAVASDEKEQLEAYVDPYARLNWMALHTAEGDNPVGECVDPASPVGLGWLGPAASSPDLYEHGGVFVYGAHLLEGTALPLNPLNWKL